MQKLLSCGKIVNTHGLKGDVKMELWCDGPDFILQFNSLFVGERLLEIEKTSFKGNYMLVKFKGIDSIEDAIQLKGKTVYIDRDWKELPAGVYYFVDLIGLSVVDNNTGEKYGDIIDVFHSAAQDIYTVKAENGKEYLMPAVSEFIAKTDIEGGRLYVTPIPGMFDDED